MLKKSLCIFTISLFVVVSLSFAENAPVTITNCGISQTYEAAPERTVTLIQASLEIMLGLGLENKIVGAAYIENPIYPPLEEAFKRLPKIYPGQNYPSKEEVLSEEPDFIYATFSSAFNPQRGNADREELETLGIHSYLSAAYCSDKALRPSPWTMDVTYNEIRDIARIFRVEDRADTLIAQMQDEIAAVQATVKDVAIPLRVFWFDSNMETPFVPAGEGAPNEIIQLAGGKNLFDDLEGNWANVSWEEVIARNPEVIVLVDAEWTSVEEKKKLLKTDPRFSDLTAVKQDRFMTIEFVYTTEGVRNAEAVSIIAKGLYPEKFNK